MEFLAKGLGRNIKHRRPTHIFTHWLIVALVFTLVWDYQGIGMAFVWGGVSHILTDAMTVSGGGAFPHIVTDDFIYLEAGLELAILLNTPSLLA